MQLFLFVFAYFHIVDTCWRLQAYEQDILNFEPLKQLLNKMKMFYMYMKEGYLNNLKHKMCLNYFILVLLTAQFHADSLTALTHSARIYNVNGRETEKWCSCVAPALSDH